MTNKDISADLDWLAKHGKVLKEAAEREKRVKDALKTKGAGSYTCGNYTCVVEERGRTTYDIPQDVKDQYKGQAVSVYVSWQPKGGVVR